MLKIVKKHFLWLILSPLFLNFFYNSLSLNFKIFFSKYHILNFISSLLLFFLLIKIANMIHNLFPSTTISFCIAIYFFSFFIFDNILIFFFDISSINIFIFVNILWFLFFLISKKITQLALSKAVLLYLVNYFFNFFNKIFLIDSSSIKDDVEAMWYPWANLINNNSYLYLLENNPREGYGLLASYIHSVLFKINFLNIDFFYSPPTTMVFFFLTIFFLYELDTSKLSRLVVITTYSVLILNSDWLRFLFTNSLMSEGVLSYFFCVVFLELIKIWKSEINHNNYSIIILFSGFLIFSKYFLNILILLFFLLFLLKRSKLFFAFLGFVPLAIRELQFHFVLSNSTKDEYLQNINFFEFFIDLVTLRNIYIPNIFNIFTQFIVDKPLSYFIFISFLYFLYNLKQRNIDYQISIVTLFLLINFIFVNILYTTVWVEIEIESSFRYILNTFHLILVWSVYNFDYSKSGNYSELENFKKDI